MSDPQQLPPHLIIRFKMVGGEEQFEWGVTRGVPMLGLLGALCKAQIMVMTHPPYPMSNDGEFPPGALVIQYEKGGQNEFTIACDPTIPTDPLVGMLELIKGMVRENINRSNEANKSMQRVIVGLDGKQIGRG